MIKGEILRFPVGKNKYLVITEEVNGVAVWDAEITHVLYEMPIMDFLFFSANKNEAFIWAVKRLPEDLKNANN